MKTLSITNLRKDLYNIAENTIAHNDPVRIATKRGGAAVLLSEDDYSSLLETIYLLSAPGMRDILLGGKNEPLSDGVPLQEAQWLTK
jgi:PHD/YefM family antitoxin component YafN of YafNO toxin-antitoxin module